MSRLFYLMGKSACGKDSLYTELMHLFDFRPFILFTTRPMRQGEVEGVSYHFTDRARFESFLAEGKVIESRTYNTIQGPWTYYTVDDGSLDQGEEMNYLGTGTLESYLKLVAYYGGQKIIPLYVEVEDGTRLERALKREQKQPVPQYAEMCRRFLTDSEDFSEEKIRNAGIAKRFINDDFDRCLHEMADYLKPCFFSEKEIKI